MSTKQYTSVGALKKPHGLTGEMKVHLQEQYLEDFLQARVFFLKIDGVMLPHFIENIRTGNSIIVQIDEVDSREKALKIASTEMFLPTEDLLKEEEKQWIPEELAYAKYEGFHLLDATLGDLGKIERVEEYPQQEMAIVKYEGREILIPLNNHFIQEIDETARQIKVDLPEGLV